MQYGSTMMRRNAIFAILALAAAFVCPAEDGNSDEKIKRMIVRSNFYIVDYAKMFRCYITPCIYENF